MVERGAVLTAVRIGRRECEGGERGLLGGSGEIDVEPRLQEPPRSAQVADWFIFDKLNRRLMQHKICCTKKILAERHLGAIGEGLDDVLESGGGATGRTIEDKTL